MFGKALLVFCALQVFLSLALECLAKPTLSYSPTVEYSPVTTQPCCAKTVCCCPPTDRYVPITPCYPSPKGPCNDGAELSLFKPACPMVVIKKKPNLREGFHFMDRGRLKIQRRRLNDLYTCGPLNGNFNVKPLFSQDCAKCYFPISDHANTMRLPQEPGTDSVMKTGSYFTTLQSLGSSPTDKQSTIYERPLSYEAEGGSQETSDQSLSTISNVASSINQQESNDRSQNKLQNDAMLDREMTKEGDQSFAMRPQSMRTTPESSDQREPSDEGVVETQEPLNQPDLSPGNGNSVDEQTTIESAQGSTTPPQFNDVQPPKQSESADRTLDESQGCLKQSKQDLRNGSPHEITTNEGVPNSSIQPDSYDMQAPSIEQRESAMEETQEIMNQPPVNRDQPSMVQQGSAKEYPQISNQLLQIENGPLKTGDPGLPKYSYETKITPMNNPVQLDACRLSTESDRSTAGSQSVGGRTMYVHDQPSEPSAVGETHQKPRNLMSPSYDEDIKFVGTYSLNKVPHVVRYKPSTCQNLLEPPTYPGQCTVSSSTACGQSKAGGCRLVYAQSSQYPQGLKRPYAMSQSIVDPSGSKYTRIISPPPFLSKQYPAESLSSYSEEQSLAKQSQIQPSKPVTTHDPKCIYLQDTYDPKAQSVILYKQVPACNSPRHYLSTTDHSDPSSNHLETVGFSNPTLCRYILKKPDDTQKILAIVRYKLADPEAHLIDPSEHFTESKHERHSKRSCSCCPCKSSCQCGCCSPCCKCGCCSPCCKCGCCSPCCKCGCCSPCCKCGCCSPCCKCGCCSPCCKCGCCSPCCKCGCCPCCPSCCCPPSPCPPCCNYGWSPPPFLLRACSKHKSKCEENDKPSTIYLTFPSLDCNSNNTNSTSDLEKPVDLTAAPKNDEAVKASPGVTPQNTSSNKPTPKDAAVSNSSQSIITPNVKLKPPLYGTPEKLPKTKSNI